MPTIKILGGNKHHFEPFSAATNDSPESQTTPSIPSLLAQLKNDVKDAMRSKNQGKLNVVKGLLSDITYASKAPDANKKQPLTDLDIFLIIQRAISRRQDSINQFSAAGRVDLASAEKIELNILQSYLPDQLSDPEIREEVKKVIDATGAASCKDLGRVMKAIKLDSGRATKKRISEIAKELLS
ncbi:hypothetical protein G9A89_009518 [Geosiphon pyriformis]|nr:hypothetical protein G9A89_009518 [Geosiphon pyriformis]